MTTVFEVCQWLVLERPDVLMMANQMRNTMNTSLDSSTTDIVHQPAPNNNNHGDKVLLFCLYWLNISC